jgi:pimeloyl-ACP methyl ester carboxylesterase
MRNTLSVRVKDEGGAVAERVTPKGSTADLSARRILVFVHGFGNSKDKAESSYWKMIDQLAWNVGAGQMSRLGPIWEFYWPGDQIHWREGVGPIRGYRRSLKETPDVGRLLAGFLARRPRGQDVYVVAHSMGCRITLEVLKAVRDGSLPTRGAAVRGTFLMAAAVPIRHCSADVNEAKYAIAAASCVESILYSNNDRVLQMAFRAGQNKRGPEGGEAVGFAGGPPQRWKNRERTGFGHSDYWGSRAASLAIARELGVEPTRGTPIASLPESKLPILGVPIKRLKRRLLGERP